MPNGQQRQVQAVVTESVWAKQLPSNQNWILWSCFCWRYKLIPNSSKIDLFLLKTTFKFAYIGTPGAERGLSIVLKHLRYSKQLYWICQVGSSMWRTSCKKYQAALGKACCVTDDVTGAVTLLFFCSFGHSFRNQWKADPLALVVPVALRWLLSTAIEKKL